eukprot:c17613_g1_i1.p1 GENE.c17613_g1_i1~~c17613_g1_i1.p1  ORF type:complete len:456 (-),score=107.03 c17613_g1_i1:77-1390(-)
MTPTVATQQPSLHFFGPALPACQAIVFVEVARENPAADDGESVKGDLPFLYVRLLEFGGLLGTIVVEEITPKHKKSKSPFRGLRIGKRFAAVVVNIDTKADTNVTFIDLSKKDLTDSVARHNAQIKFDKAEKLNRLIEQCSDQCNIPFVELVKSIAWPLYQRCGSVHPLDTIASLAQKPDIPKFLQWCPSCSAETARILLQASSKLVPSSSSLKPEASTQNLENEPDCDDEGADNDEPALDELKKFVQEILAYGEGQLRNFTLKEVLDSARLELVVFRGANNHSNTDILHCLLSSVFHTAISTCKCSRAQCAELLRALQRLFAQWNPLIKAFMDKNNVSLCNFKVPQGQLELMFWVVEFCSRDLAGEPGGTAHKLGFGCEELFAGVVCSLYKEELDLLDEEVILAWAEYCAQHHSSCDPEILLLGRCDKLLRCLRAE